MNKLVAFFFFFVLVFSSNSFSQALTAEEREIIQIQDRRIVGSEKIAAYLSHSDERVRTRALLAIANIEDTSAVQKAVAALNDPIPKVRSAAAFALSHIAPDTVSAVLFRRLMTEENADVQNALLHALGFLATASVLDSLTELPAAQVKAFLREELALCYARCAMRGLKTERSVWRCFDLLRDTNSAVRWKALYALWRSAPYELIDIELAKNEDVIGNLIRDGDRNIRVQLANLLSRVHGLYRAAFLDSLESYEIKTQNDWRVLVAVIKARAAQVIADQNNFSRLANYIYHVHPYVRIAALQALAQIPLSVVLNSGFAEAVAKNLTEIADDSVANPPMVRGEALVTIGKLFPLYFDKKDSLWQSYSDPYLKRKRIEAFAQSLSESHLDTIVTHLLDPNIRVAMTAWDYSRNFLTLQALRALKFDSARAMNLFTDLCNKAEVTLKRGDIALTTILADLGSSATTAWIFGQPPHRERMSAAFMNAYNALSTAESFEAKRMILQTLRTIGTESCVPFLERAAQENDPRLRREALLALAVITKKEVSLPSLSGSFQTQTINWKLYEALPEHPHVQFVTTRGTFVMELYKSEAPLTTLSFAQLVEKKFYDGLTFHRVVPGFVIQGGDPRGDGWGGPGSMLRTEISPLSFDEGICGMASAGKDTEGSQFFITQLPAPHLEGRYTIFGKVIEGMDVVNSIIIGDVILSARMLE